MKQIQQGKPRFRLAPMQAFLCFLMLSLFASLGHAQTNDKKWNLGLMAGFSVYAGDYGNSMRDFRYESIRQNPTAGLHISRYLNPSFDVALNTTFGSYGYYSNGYTIFKGDLFQGNLNLRYKLNNGYMLSEDSRLAPYLFAGAGMASFTGARINEGLDYPILGGLGIRYRVSSKITLNYQATYGFFTTAHYNPNASYPVPSGNDKFMLHMVGIGLDLGASKADNDLDKDGIVNSKDNCANTPADAKVDANGCPLDTDLDGVADHLDKCPDLAGSPMSFGCPDTDADGVYDDADLCKNIPGVPENYGCPAIEEKVQQLFQKALQGIRFETGKAIIKPESFPILNAIVKVMEEHPDYKLIIGGHTDNVGDDEMNYTLSKDRAASVSNYLITKGVSPMRVYSDGFGETKPVDTNDSENGRTRNRRVEFKVEFLQ